MSDFTRRNGMLGAVAFLAALAAWPAFAGEGAVLTVEGAKIMTDMGGVKVGDRVAVFRRHDRVFHPVTGALLEELIETVAVAKVVEVDDAFSFAQVEQTAPGGKVQAGDLVRCPATGKPGSKAWAPPGGKLLLDDKFADGKLANWAPFKGKWRAAGGKLVALRDVKSRYAGIGSKALFGDNVAVEFEASVPHLPANGRVGANFYDMAEKRQHYFFDLTANAGAAVRKGRTQLAHSDAFKLKQGVKLSVRLRRTRGCCSLTVDGKELLTFFDWDSPQGKTDLGLFAVDCSACFANVRIFAYPSAKPVVDGPTDAAAGYVCAAKNGQVRVDHGKGRVTKGQKLTLARCVKVVDDPKTRKPFAIKLQRLGEAEVVDVGSLTAGVRVVSGKGIKVGDRALLEAPKAASWWRRVWTH